MPNSVLVPLDGSPLAEAILIPAKRFLAPQGALTLLRVVNVEAGTQSEQEDLLDRVQEYMDLQAKTLTDEGIPTTAVVRRGSDTAGEILDCIAERRPDLVAMSTHGRTGLTRLVRGSVAERVLRGSSAPLLLCNPETPLVHPLRHVLVPLDGSERSAAVLPLVATLAAASEDRARVTLLRVVPFIPPAVGTPVLPLEAFDPEKVKASLKAEHELLVRAGIQVTRRVVKGVEVEEILDASTEADLIAMTTHGRSGVSRWWFGSVAEQVLRHCHRPLLVVRITD